MQKFYSRGLLACFSLITLISCQDYDGGFDSDTIKKESYAKDFEKTFGKIDPNQDWSMASTLQANVTVGSNPSVVIYSEKPGYAGSTVLGLVNGKSAVFNGLKGSEQIYAVVTENGKTIASGYYDVVNGVVNINNQPVVKRNLQTRAAGDLAVGDYLFTHTAYSLTETDWDGVHFCVDGANYMKYENGTYYLSDNGLNGTYYVVQHHYNEENQYNKYWEWLCEITPTGCTITELMQYKFYKNDDGSPIFTTGQGNQGARKVEGPKHWDAKYYTIEGNTKTTDVTWKVGDCKTLFWDADPFPFFKEQVDYRHPDKMALYTGNGVSLSDVEAGVVYTTANDDSEINIPMMFGATQNFNILGYYYYKDNQDFRTVNRYVLYEDARPNSNIKVNGTAVGNMDLQANQGWADDAVVTCTSRRLVYFGDDGKSAGTFKFPKDVHIGFFIMRSHGDDYSGVTRDEVGWAYSDPELNKQYFNDWVGSVISEIPNNNWSYGGHGYVEDDATRGKVRALTWNYNGRILVGFGDQANDYDLNDFVFWVDGEFKEEPKIKITTETLETSWIFACEDLGGTFDYDFNDVVWEVAQKYEEEYADGAKTGNITYKNIEIRLLAAGGTLPVNLVYNGEDLGEVHQQLAGAAAASLYTPVNITAPKATYAPKVVKTINATTQMDISTLKELFKLKVKGADGQAYYVTTPDANEHNSGNAKPQIILLPATWEWPIENKCIKDAYPGFTNWANNATANDWLSKKTNNAWYVKKK